MIEQIYIEKFNKIIDSYGISKSIIFDIVKAMSFSESFGSHQISLKALANSGVAYFAGIADKDGTLPDARLYRVLADSLAIALYMRDSSLVSDDILSKLSANVADVLSCAADYRGKPDYYKSAEECKDVIEMLYVDKEAWKELEEFDKYLDSLFKEVTGDIQEFIEYIKSKTEKYKCPIKSKYFGAYKEVVIVENPEYIIKQIKEDVVSSVISYCVKKFVNVARVNENSANLKLRRVVDSGSCILVGCSSSINNSQVVDVYYKNIPIYIKSRFDKIFTRSKCLCVDDLYFLFAFYDFYNSSLLSQFQDSLNKFSKYEK